MLLKEMEAQLFQARVLTSPAAGRERAAAVGKPGECCCGRGGGVLLLLLLWRRRAHRAVIER